VVDLVTEAIGRLSDQAQSVGDIITTVNDLAEQSNLLSVNAAIEAAKAGDYGKGFTVVAQEVKALAEQSKQAAAQARNVLTDIRKASDQAVQAVAESRNAVDIGRDEVGVAIESRKAEAELARRTADAVLQISATSRQQLAGMEQISLALNSINAAGTQSVAGTRQVEEEGERLREMADGLEALVDAGGGRGSARERAGVVLA
jgi:methyl-accepting chemotaxis protein